MALWQEIIFLAGVIVTANLGAALAASAQLNLFMATSYYGFRRQWRCLLCVSAFLTGMAIAFLIWLYWLPSSFGWNLGRLIGVLPPVLVGAFHLWQDYRERRFWKGHSLGMIQSQQPPCCNFFL